MTENLTRQKVFKGKVLDPIGPKHVNKRLQTHNGGKDDSLIKIVYGHSRSEKKAVV